MNATVGVVVFVVALVVSVTLHEFGHLVSAKAFGMKARRFFFGFGPTLWSFHRGETEYGIKAVPAGGFVDIAGMTAQETLSPTEAPRAFYRRPAWQRLTVMVAGVAINLVTGWLVLVVALLSIGTAAPSTSVAAVSPCLAVATATTATAPTCQAGAAPSPAGAAGVRVGDRIVDVAGVPTPTWQQVVTAIQQAGPGPVSLTVQRGSARLTLHPSLAAGTLDGKVVGRLGVSPGVVYSSAGVLGSLRTASSYSWLVTTATAKAIVGIPAAIPNLVRSAMGEAPRSQNGLISVVGAARVSGDLAALPNVPVQGRLFDLLTLVAGLNLTVGLLNLVPLPPFDGGHMAAILVEVVRNRVLRLLGRRPMGHVDPASYQVLTVLGVVVILLFGVLVLTNDLVNPIVLPQ